MAMGDEQAMTCTSNPTLLQRSYNVGLSMIVPHEPSSSSTPNTTSGFRFRQAMAIHRSYAIASHAIAMIRLATCQALVQSNWNAGRQQQYL